MQVVLKCYIKISKLFKKRGAANEEWGGSMKILVTGAAGYIGSILTPLLLQEKHEVIALDNLMYNQETPLSNCCHYPGFEPIFGSTTNTELLKELIKKVDCIIPLAALVGLDACNNDPVAATATNLEAINLILRLRSKSQIIIYPNSNSGYGIGQEGIYCTEKTPLKPLTLYGRTKVEAEKAVMSDGNAITFRLGTVAGVSPRIRLDLMVNEFVLRALTDRCVTLYGAHFKRNFVHVRDVAKAFIHGINNFDKMNGEVYNVGLNDINMSKLELCQEIQKQIPNFYFHEAPMGEDPDKRNYIVSNAKLEKAGFKATITLSETIAELIKGLRLIRPRQYKNA